MNGRSLAMLGMAILCGLGAMYGTTKMLAKGKTGPVVEMQDVVVASHDLKIEEVIKPDALKVVRMARSAVPGGAFTSAKDVEDRWVQIGMLEGEPILDRKLAARGTPPGLVARIPKGMRAFAVEVNEQTGVSGFILPDHRVDVVQIEPNPSSSSRAEAETVLQDVLVLASGQTFTRPDDRSIQARTVTLAVGPDQVDSLVAARSRGPLSLSLRGLNDHTRTTVKVIKKPEPATPPPAPEPPAPVAAAPSPPPAPVAVKPPDSTPVVPRVRSVLVHRGLRRSERIRLSAAPDEEQDAGPAPAAEAAAEGSVRRN